MLVVSDFAFSPKYKLPRQQMSLGKFCDLAQKCFKAFLILLGYSVEKTLKVLAK